MRQTCFFPEMASEASPALDKVAANCRHDSSGIIKSITVAQKLPNAHTL